MDGTGHWTDGQAILDGYAAEASRLIRAYEAMDTAEVLAPVLHLLPAAPCSILDVGAGTGRDAAWLAERGHRIVAVEPVPALRAAGMALHPSPRISWIEDRLPALETLRRRGDVYDLVLLVGVLHHLPPAEQMRALVGLAGLTAPGGRLIISLRHGPGSPPRPCFPVSAVRIADALAAAGLHPILSRNMPSLQPENRRMGVTWTWLCSDRRGGA